ncbi:hypothetical protein ABPG73_003936, partial [Tetrahymena malaccensis]
INSNLIIYLEDQNNYQMNKHELSNHDILIYSQSVKFEINKIKSNKSSQIAGYLIEIKSPFLTKAQVQYVKDQTYHDLIDTFLGEGINLTQIENHQISQKNTFETSIKIISYSIDNLILNYLKEYIQSTNNYNLIVVSSKEYYQLQKYVQLSNQIQKMERFNFVINAKLVNFEYQYDIQKLNYEIEVANQILAQNNIQFIRIYLQSKINNLTIPISPIIEIPQDYFIKKKLIQQRENILQVNLSKIYLKPIEDNLKYERFEYSKPLSYLETEEFDLIIQIIYKDYVGITDLIILAQPLECESNIEMISYINLGQNKQQICDRNPEFKQNNLCVYHLNGQVEQQFQVVIKCLSEKCLVQIYLSLQKEFNLNLSSADNQGLIVNSFVHIYYIQKYVFMKQNEIAILIQGKFNKVLTFSQDIFGNEDCITYKIYLNQVTVIQYKIECETKILIAVIQSFSRQIISFEQAQVISIEKQTFQINRKGVQQCFFTDQADCFLVQVQQKIQPFDIIMLQPKAFVDLKCEHKTQLYLFQLKAQLYNIYSSHQISQIKNYEIIRQNKYHEYYQGDLMYCYKFLQSGYRVYSYKEIDSIILDKYIQNTIKEGLNFTNFSIKLQERTFQTSTEVCFQDYTDQYQDNKGHIIISTNNENLHYIYNLTFHNVQVNLSEYFIYGEKIADMIYISKHIRSLKFINNNNQEEFKFGLKIRGINGNKITDQKCIYFKKEPGYFEAIINVEELNKNKQNFYLEFINYLNQIDIQRAKNITFILNKQLMFFQTENIVNQEKGFYILSLPKELDEDFLIQIRYNNYDQFQIFSQNVYENGLLYPVSKQKNDALITKEIRQRFKIQDFLIIFGFLSDSYEISLLGMYKTEYQIVYQFFFDNLLTVPAQEIQEKSNGKISIITQNQDIKLDVISPHKHKLVNKFSNIKFYQFQAVENDQNELEKIVFQLQEQYQFVQTIIISFGYILETNLRFASNQLLNQYYRQYHYFIYCMDTINLGKYFRISELKYYRINSLNELSFLNKLSEQDLSQYVQSIKLEYQYIELKYEICILIYENKRTTNDNITLITYELKSKNLQDYEEIDSYTSITFTQTKFEKMELNQLNVLNSQKAIYYFRSEPNVKYRIEVKKGFSNLPIKYYYGQEDPLRCTNVQNFYKREFSFLNETNSIIYDPYYRFIFFHPEVESYEIQISTYTKVKLFQKLSDFTFGENELMEYFIFENQNMNKIFCYSIGENIMIDFNNFSSKQCIYIYPQMSVRKDLYLQANNLYNNINKCTMLYCSSSIKEQNIQLSVENLTQDNHIILQLFTIYQLEFQNFYRVIQINNLENERIFLNFVIQTEYISSQMQNYIYIRYFDLFSNLRLIRIQLKQQTQSLEITGFQTFEIISQTEQVANVIFILLPQQIIALEDSVIDRRLIISEQYLLKTFQDIILIVFVENIQKQEDDFYEQFNQLEKFNSDLIQIYSNTDQIQITRLNNALDLNQEFHQHFLFQTTSESLSPYFLNTFKYRLQHVMKQILQNFNGYFIFLQHNEQSLNSEFISIGKLINQNFVEQNGIVTYDMSINLYIQFAQLQNKYSFSRVYLQTNSSQLLPISSIYNNSLQMEFQRFQDHTQKTHNKLIILFLIQFLQFFVALQQENVLLNMNVKGLQVKEQYSTYLLQGETITYHLRITNSQFAYFFFLAQDQGQCSLFSTQLMLSQKDAEEEQQELCQESLFKQNNFSSYSEIPQPVALVSYSLKQVKKDFKEYILINSQDIKDLVFENQSDSCIKQIKRYGSISYILEIDTFQCINQSLFIWVISKRNTLKIAMDQLKSVDNSFSYDLQNYIYTHIFVIGQCNVIYTTFEHILESNQNDYEIEEKFLILKITNTNPQQIQNDLNGIACSINVLNSEKNDHYIFVDGQGFIEYKYIQVIKYLIYQDKYFGHISSKINQSQYPLYISNDQDNSPQVKLSIKYHNKCQIVRLDEAKNQMVELVSFASSPQEIYDINISYFYQFNKSFKEIQNAIEQKFNFNTQFFYYSDKNGFFKIQLPQELKNDSFIIYYEESNFFTIFVKEPEKGDFLMPLQFQGNNYLIVEKEMSEKYWKDDPLIIKADKIQQLKFFKNYYDFKMQIQNYSFDQKIKISIDQLILSNYTLYIDQNSQVINRIETNLSYQIQATMKLLKITFKINKDQQKEQEGVVIWTCCYFIFRGSMIIYFKYLLEQENFYIPDYYLDQIVYRNEEFFIYCWGNSENQQYYRQSTLFYTRIYNKEDLRKFYELERYVIMQKLKFTLKSVDQSIDRESEICLALFQNAQAKEMNIYNITLNDENIVQEINFEETLYEHIQLKNAINKLIIVYYDSAFYDCQINQYNCYTDQQYYSLHKLSYIFFQRRISSEKQFSTKIQIIVINQQIRWGLLEKNFQLVSSEWIEFELEPMTDYQLVTQGKDEQFQLDYELSNFQILMEKCTNQIQNKNEKIAGLLTYENNLFNSQEYKILYLKASQDFKYQQIQFKLQYYSKISKINTKIVEIYQHTLSFYLFDAQYSRKIFKIINQGNLSFQISKCQADKKNIQYKPLNGNEDDFQKVKQTIQNDYFFIYPEICEKQSQDNFLQQDQNCLQINQSKEFLYQNAIGIIDEETTTTKLQLNQIFNTQLNSENQFTIIELENSYQDYYCYLEYESIAGTPVSFEIRYLQNGSFLQSFYFKQYQEIKVLQLQGLKYLEIYNYKLNTTFNLILMISEKHFTHKNVYSNKIKLQSQEAQILLLKSNSPKNIFIFHNQVNYTIKEIVSNSPLKKQFYFLEVNNLNTYISIKKQLYFLKDNSDGDGLYVATICSEIIQEIQLDIDSIQEKYSPRLLEGESITYLMQLKTIKVSYFQAMVQDEGKCSKFSTIFTATYYQQGQNQHLEEQICTQNIFNENNFCEYEIKKSFIFLKLKIKCLSQTCFMKSSFFLDDTVYYIEEMERHLVVQRPIFLFMLKVKPQSKQYFLIHSEDIKDIYFEQNKCIQAAVYGNISYVLEFSKQECQQDLIITVISKCDTLNVIFYHLVSYDSISQDLKSYLYTHIFVIGQCKANYSQFKYVLENNIFYSLNMYQEAKHIEFECEKQSVVLLLKKKSNDKIEQKFLKIFELNKKSYINLQFFEYSLDRYEICFKIEDLSMQIYYGSQNYYEEDSELYFDSEYLANQLKVDKHFQQLQIYQKGRACINSKLRKTISQNDIDQIIIIGKGFLEYEYFEEKVSLTYYEGTQFGQICLKIKKNAQSFLLENENLIEAKVKVVIKYANECQTIYLDQNQKHEITLESKSPSYQSIQDLQTYYYRSLQDVQNIAGQIFRIRFEINSDYQMEQENIQIKMCCNQIYELPVILYFKYLYEERDNLIEGQVLTEFQIRERQLFFIFCWSDPEDKQYYRYQPLYYARINSEEQLETFYQLDTLDIQDKFQFFLKKVDEQINRGQEICLALLKNEKSNLNKQINFKLENLSEVQVIDIDHIYEIIYIQNTRDKIIYVKLEDYDNNYQISYKACYHDPSLYYSQNNNTILVFNRQEDDSVYYPKKMQIKIFNQQIIKVNLENTFEFLSSEWILLELELMVQYQLATLDQKDQFQIDYWLSSYELSKNQCIKYDESVLDVKLDGFLTNNKNIINNTDFKLLYLKASPGFNNQSIKFKLRYYNKIEFINKESISINQQTLSIYLFDIKYQQKIFKIEYSNELNFQIFQCQLNTKSAQLNLNNNSIKDKSNYNYNQNKIKYAYMFIYPEICIRNGQLDLSNDVQLKDQFCLYVDQKVKNENSMGFIQQETVIQKLFRNQVFNIQLNSQSNQIIFEVEESYPQCYLYFEYQSIDDHPVSIEVRQLVNSTYLQSFQFNQFQVTKILNLQNLKYLEIYNYEQNAQINLTLIVSNESFQFVNIYQNKIKVNSQNKPLFLLLIRLEDQSIVVHMQNNVNNTLLEQKIESGSLKNIYIIGNQTNYQIKELGSNTFFMKKQFYLLEVLENQVSISINKYYSSANEEISEVQEDNSSYQISQSLSVFKFNITYQQIESLKGFNIQKLQNEQLYFVYSDNYLQLMQQFSNGINSVDLIKNIRIFKQRVLELKQVNKDYEITTSHENKMYQYNDDLKYQYLRIYFVNKQSSMVPLSKILKQPTIQQKQKIIHKFSTQLQILVAILIIILIFIFILLIQFYKIKSHLKQF